MLLTEMLQELLVQDHLSPGAEGQSQHPRSWVCSIGNTIAGSLLLPLTWRKHLPHLADPAPHLWSTASLRAERRPLPAITSLPAQHPEAFVGDMEERRDPSVHESKEGKCKILKVRL